MGQLFVKWSAHCNDFIFMKYIKISIFVNLDLIVGIFDHKAFSMHILSPGVKVLNKFSAAQQSFA